MVNEAQNWCSQELPCSRYETQAREIERLSYALGCIANEDWKDMTVGSARDLARAALGESHDQ